MQHLFFALESTILQTAQANFLALMTPEGNILKAKGHPGPP